MNTFGLTEEDIKLLIRFAYDEDLYGYASGNEEEDASVERIYKAYEEVAKIDNEH